MRIRPGRVEDHPALVRVWRSAVDVTHDFPAVADRDGIEACLAPDYLPAVELLVAEAPDGRVLSFAGVLNGALEMLFVDAAEHGTGVGSALLVRAVREHAVTRVNVNEQNPAALAFYLRRGLEAVGRSETDEAGRPYLLLHLRLRP
ncbi:GCN5 family acetyltransferase [Actinomyces radicidentis]|uniref:GCN5 family acetyltransferase n=1 Tax=Actinomyces radicidentis TaxID=111015 RepID=A0A0X8JF81_ACTRD|nr:GNAT family N-acetyltransferase [Actinomyces radicidentis]AMD87343.1 GCN5 family acetyltransferase [Actinomyces radicidentis]